MRFVICLTMVMCSPFARAGADAEARVLEAADAMQEKAEFYAAREDKRAIFAAVHVQTLLEIHDAIAEDGFFESPPTVATVAEQFEERFEKAMAPIDAYLEREGLWGNRLTHRQRVELRSAMGVERERSSEPPQAWVDAFVATQGSHSLVIEDALFPIVSHIEYDLAVVVAKMAVECSRQGHSQRAAFGRDMEKVNEVMERSIAGVFDRLGRSSWRYRAMDLAMWKFDEVAGQLFVERLRDRALVTAAKIESGAEVELGGVTERAVCQTRICWLPGARLLSGIPRVLLPERRRWSRVAEPDPRLP